MKKIILLTIPSLFTVGCTSTRMDDHSYRVNAAPPNIITTYNRNTTNNTTHNYAPETNRCVQEPYNVQNNVYQKDKEYLQFIQEDPTVDNRREKGMYIEYDKYNRPTVVAESWKAPITSRNYIPPGNAGIPVYYVR